MAVTIPAELVNRAPVALLLLPLHTYNLVHPGSQDVIILFLSFSKYLKSQYTTYTDGSATYVYIK